MVHVLILGIIAVSLAWLEGIGKFKHGMKSAFILIFLFLTLRYDFGNDYMGYLFQFVEIRNIRDVEYFHFRYNEVGWWYLNYFFSLLGPVGFFIMYGVIAAFTSFVGYRFIKKYVSVKYFGLAVFLYIFQPDNVLVLSSGIRQFIAVSIFLLSIDYLVNRQYLRYLLLLIFASLFHTSVLVFVPLIFLNLVNWRIRTPYIIIFLIAFISLIYLQRDIFNQVDEFLAFYLNEYEAYTKSGFEKVSFGLGFFFNAGIYLFVLYSGSRENKRDVSIFYKLVVISLLLIALSLALNMVSRLSYYLYPTMIVAYTFTLSRLPKLPVLRSGFFLSVVIFTVYQFYHFWISPVYRPYFEKYQTIFSSSYLGF